MLAVGIGAITTIFTEVNAVFLKTLPVAAERLRKLSWTSRARAFAGPQFGRYGDAIMARGGTIESFPYSVYSLMQTPLAGVDSVACMAGGSLRLVGDGGLGDSASRGGDSGDGRTTQSRVSNQSARRAARRIDQW